MDQNYCSSLPDSVVTLMSAEPVDSGTQVKVSGNAELPLTAQSGGLSNLASSEQALTQSDTGGGCKDELDEWKKVSYFNPTTGTSIIKITSEMFKKSRASSVQAEQNGSVEFIDSDQRCNFDSRNVCAAKHSGHEALLSSGMSSSGAGELLKQRCFGEVVSSETAHSGHSLDILGDGKVELDNDINSSDILFIDEPDYDTEEKVIFMDDKEEQTVWEPVVAHQVKEPTGNLKDAFKDLSFSASQLPLKESSLQGANEKLRGDLAEACVNKENKMEAGFNDHAAVDVAEWAESGQQENDYKCNIVADYNKTTNISSMPKSLNVEASDSRSKISPGPLRLTRLAKSTAQSEISYSVSTPSFFSAYHPTDVNINNNVCQTSVSSILSLDSRTSSRDEMKGWTRDRGSFAPDLPESSCQADASDSWAELEDLPAQSLGESIIHSKSA